MPLKWVEPQEFLTHRGVTVYHTYKSSNYENRSSNWYTTSISEDEEFEFDVRDLKIPEAIVYSDHESIIKHHIEEKKLLLPENINYNH